MDAFRETAINGIDMGPVKNTTGQPRGTIQGSVQSGLVEFSIRAVPLPEQVTNFLQVNMKTLKRLHRDRRNNNNKLDDEDSTTTTDETSSTSGGGGESIEGVELVKPEEFWEKFSKILDRFGGGKEFTSELIDQIWAFGPRRVGPNLLVDKTLGSPRSLRKKLERQAALPSALATPGSTTSSASALEPPQTPLSPPEQGQEFSSNELPGQGLDLSSLKNSLTKVDLSEEAMMVLPDVRELDENFDTAFQLSTNRGPLCAEPVIGMCYFFEKVELNSAEMEISQVRSKWSNARGQLISAGQEAFRNGLLDWSPRLQLAMYSCDIQATGEVLGKVYAVVSKRKGRIISEEMKEGTAFFTVSALLPVVESFGFADEIRTRTSGAASPQLVFKGYETLDQDPFWVPTTEEELEDLGEKADKENIAKKYMDQVRRRKGMTVERKVVLHAEKQKTIKNA
ncbi:hypothetical protein JCM3765_006772 [Sporobolomyces pararoseus]